MTDTSLSARSQLTSVFAAMSGAERLRLATEMADEARLITIAGIRFRSPELDDAEVTAEWLRLLHCDELAARLAGCSSTS